MSTVSEHIDIPLAPAPPPRMGRFLALDMLFEGGRMFVGATSVLYLLSRGFQLQDIATLKSVQAAVILVGEFPTGLVADVVGRRLSLALALLLGGAGFLLFFTCDTWAWFCVAECLTALSLCFWSGCYEAYAIDSSGLASSPQHLDRFFYLNQTCNSVAVMAFGFAGGLIAARGVGLPYLGAALTFGAAMAWLVFALPRDVQGSRVAAEHTPLRVHLRNAFADGILRPAVLPLFLASLLVQLVIQPILHYWQPLFQELDPSVETTALGTTFIAYAGASAVFGSVYAAIAKRAWVRSASFMLTLFMSFSVLYMLVGQMRAWLPALVVFCLLQGSLASVRSFLSARINERITSSSRASVLSSLSLFSRVGMMGALAIIHWQLSGRDGERLSVVNLYNLFSTVSIGLCVLMVIFLLVVKNDKKRT
ncbi:MFS transporter [Sorangium sp. So ce367]|uniref:MFS transporter n=1 Tax=Sorangium sp. So ce367 TaxID=3133305 RepID=UPI003F60D7F0